MGQNPGTPVNIPKTFKIDYLGRAFSTPKRYPFGFDPQPIKFPTRQVLRDCSGRVFKKISNKNLGFLRLALPKPTPRPQSIPPKRSPPWPSRRNRINPSYHPNKNKNSSKTLIPMAGKPKRNQKSSNSTSQLGCIKILDVQKRLRGPAREDLGCSSQCSP